MNKTLKRVMIVSVSTLGTVFLAGCPKNSEGIDAPATAPKGDASNPLYLKSMQATPISPNSQRNNPQYRRMQQQQQQGQ